MKTKQAQHTQSLCRCGHDIEKHDDDPAGSHDCLVKSLDGRRCNCEMFKQEAGFTPGPWKVSLPHVKPEGALGYMLTMSRYPEAEADARLIAAAPDLLEAAKYLFETYGEVLQSHMVPSDWNKLRAAIAKAEGK